MKNRFCRNKSYQKQHWCTSRFLLRSNCFIKIISCIASNECCKWTISFCNASLKKLVEKYNVTRKIESLYAAFNTQRKNWWNKPKKCRQCILRSEWREKRYLWHLLWWRLFAVKGLKCRYFQKNNCLTLMDNPCSGSKENTYLFF